MSDEGFRVQSVEPHAGCEPAVREHPGSSPHDCELVRAKLARDRNRATGDGIDGQLGGIEPASGREPSTQPAIARRAVTDEVTL